eukprot:COSAG02_NODE_18261_length_950_cov_1.141011_1_plen_197_part_10
MQAQVDVLMQRKHSAAKRAEQLERASAGLEELWSADSGESARKFAAQHSFTLDTRASSAWAQRHAQAAREKDALRAKRQELTEQMNSRPGKLLSSFNVTPTENRTETVQVEERDSGPERTMGPPAADLAAHQASRQEAVRRAVADAVAAARGSMAVPQRPPPPRPTASTAVSHAATPAPREQEHVSRPKRVSTPPQR